MISITLDEIQRDLVSYFQRVREGETLLIMEGDRPLAEIKPVSLSQQKK
jgi:antitoxin (DNA-binding transcriptional repressor) of toxin-antitoxin stability system